MPDGLEVSAELETALTEEWRALTAGVEEQREHGGRPVAAFVSGFSTART